jgi:hypothetical protein
MGNAKVKIYTLNSPKSIQTAGKDSRRPALTALHPAHIIHAFAGESGNNQRVENSRIGPVFADTPSRSRQADGSAG